MSIHHLKKGVTIRYARQASKNPKDYFCFLTSSELQNLQTSSIDNNKGVTVMKLRT